MKTVGLAAFLVLLAACSAGEGGAIELPCEAARCARECRAAGGRTGVCSPEDRCECVVPLDTPGGLRTSFASAGAIERQGGSYSLTLSVGPVSFGAERQGSGRALELGSTATVQPTVSR